ncbi:MULTISPECIES: nuclear transport factor 2 family protein [Niastella]|uniref:Nuclear transport factor 2 family protein n=1 Tax=Niastella soli TaxID=2821487 RepID=A0ABS3YZQ3_9BACT|nr:nuclear transport factor 2 family protein [Niastella soli]MBO9203414.1 nuclear transport factor 2 family protein [Niastella soli]
METLVHYGQKVNQLYDCFMRRDLNPIINTLSRDCIWEVMGQPDIPYAGIYHGREDVKQFFTKLNDCLDMTDFVVEHILENGNMVIASGHMNAVARKTNKRFSSFWCMTYEFNENDECVHFRDCVDTLACARAMK